MFEMSLCKLEKFNFFKKRKKAKQDVKESLIYFAKRFLKLSVFFVITPTLLYLFLKSVPELNHGLPVLLDSIRSQTLTGITLTLYCIYIASTLLKEIFNTALDEQELGKESPNIFLPILFSIEAGLVLFGLSPVWSVVWPLIR